MKIDEMLPKQWHAFINMFAMVVTSFVVMCVVTPVFTFLAIPILFFYYKIQQFYKVPFLELKRIDSMTKSREWYTATKELQSQTQLSLHPSLHSFQPSSTSSLKP
jgi:hypothetical protein